jgi:flagellar basal-body rod protein FlgF
MDRMVYVAMTGAKQVMRQQGLIAHNIANLNTDGFRADLAHSRPAPIYGTGHPTRVNTITAGDGFNHAPGTLVSTGRTLDVAVKGQGWIAVQAPDGGEAYTRAGALSINSLGLLETADGHMVMGSNGPLSVPVHVELVMGNDGTISIVPQGQGPATLASVDRVKLVNPDPALLEKGVDGLIRARDGSTADADASVQVVSGFLETSNVNMAANLVAMIENARKFEMQVKMMQTADENATRAMEMARLS